MDDILLINPNASEKTTAMMVRIAQAALGDGFLVTGISAMHGPMMIVDESELRDAAAEVERSWIRSRRNARWKGVIVSAFGDPGLDLMRATCAVPVVGICEASMLEASHGGRRFGIATVTPELVDAIDAQADRHGLRPLYTGFRLTQGDPRELANMPGALEDALADAVGRCVELDGARAVIIGGGPLGQAAIGLATRFEVPIIAPISSAAGLLRERMAAKASLGADGLA